MKKYEEMSEKKEFPAIFNKIKKCKSKKNLKILLKGLPEFWKKLICIYLKKYFIFDLYTRKLADKIYILNKREIFHQILHNPDLLDKNCHMNNNTMKNFCVGLTNYLKKNHLKISTIEIENKK